MKGTYMCTKGPMTSEAPMVHCPCHVLAPIAHGEGNECGVGA